MRKFSVAGLGLIASLAIATVAQGDSVTSPGGLTQGLEVKHSSTKAKAGFTVDIRLAIDCAPDRQCQAPPAPIGKASPVFNTVVKLPRGTKLGYRHFATCDPRRLETRGVNGCSRRSRVGKGVLTADGRPVVDTPVQGTVTAFNGTNRRYLLYVIPELSSPLVLVGKLSGLTLRIPVPAVPTLPGQPNATLTRFQIKTGGKVRKTRRRGGRKRRVTYHYLQNPSRCRGSWRWTFDFTYENGERLSPTDDVRCRR
jgi:hypothetical protein